MFSHSQLRNILPIVGLVCGTLICSGAIAGSPELDVVMYGGLENSPPNFPGLNFNLASGFTNPVIDDQGRIAVGGVLWGDGITPANNRVVWHGEEGNWTNVARNGDAAPGLGGLTLLAVTNASPILTPNGNLVVSSALGPVPPVTPATDTAFWSGAVGSLALTGRESTTVAPNTGTPGAVLSSFMGISLGTRANNAGQVLFYSNLTGGTPAVTAANNVGVYLMSTSGVTEVARKGNPIPGAPALPDPAGPFMTPDSFGLLLNGAGEVVSTGALVAGTAGGVTPGDDRVVYTTVGGSMRFVAREHDPVPGLTDVMYKDPASFGMATMGITNAGKVVFTATLDNIAPGTSVTVANDTCWLVDDHGTVSMLIREGDTIDGETFFGAQSVGGMFLTNNNRVVITGPVLPNNGRLWTGPLGGPYTRVVEQGVTTAPGMPTVILNYIAGSANVAVNGVGQIVFSSALTGAGVTPGLDDSAIFGWDPTSGLVMIARKAVTSVPEILEVAQIGLVGSTGITGENGSAILTDNGWLTFRLQDVKGFQAIVRTKPFEVELPCDADIAPPPSGNGLVNVEDLLAVIGAWGACANPKDCPADIAPVSGDDVVNVSDLLAVIGAWGACP